MAVAISLYYLAFLAAIGMYLPFFTMYLEQRGFTATDATRLMGLGPMMGLLAPPLIGLLADAERARGWILRGATLASMLAFAGFAVVSDRPALWATMAVFALMRTPILPLTDAAALDAAAREGTSYGRLRLWGSFGFLVASAAGGWFLQRTRISHMVPLTVILLGLAFFASLRLPAPPPRHSPGILRAWLRLLGRGHLWLFLGAAALSQLAGASYDAGFALHCERLGLGPRFVGSAWSFGVLSEVALLAGAARLMKAVGTRRLYAMTIAAAALRWWIVARLRSPVALFALQPLHGFTFGCFYVSGVELAREKGGAEMANAAQGLFAFSLAVGSTTGFQVVGWVLERWGGRALYEAAALVAALGALLAVLHARGGDGART
jgi:PPP family 3-phenylpropionic acid transporter